MEGVTNEVTIPLLPCASIDEISTFYEVLGFRACSHSNGPNLFKDWQGNSRTLWCWPTPALEIAADLAAALR